MMLLFSLWMLYNSTGRSKTGIEMLFCSAQQHTILEKCSIHRNSLNQVISTNAMGQRYSCTTGYLPTWRGSHAPTAPGTLTPGLNGEDLTVALADTCWKGRRVQALEQALVEQLTGAGAGDHWDVLIQLDDCIERIAAHGGRRLAWQAQFSVR